MEKDSNNDNVLSLSDSVDNANQMAIRSIQWSELPDIDTVQGFSDKDALCMRELYEVLKKHDQLDRLGIALLHKHFEITDDEFLLESTNVEQRRQTIRPVKKDDYAESEGLFLMPTIVKLSEQDGGVSLLRCLQCIPYRHHDRR